MLGVVTTAAGILVTLPAAILVPATLRVRGPLAFAVAALVVGAASVILAALALSAVDGVNAGGLLAAQAVLSGLAAVVWLGVGRPPVPHLPGLTRAAVVDFPRSDPLLAALIGSAAVALAVQLVVGLLVVPNNWDSMTYHLARAAFWLQYGSVFHWDNGTAWQLAYPPNGEILQAWTMALSDGDRFAAAVQWLSLLGLAAAIMLGARMLGFGRKGALFAGMLFVLLPQPILQATTTQNDLIVSFFLLAAVVFLVRGIRDDHYGELGIGAAALGLAVGTKGTALFALPAVGVVVGCAIWSSQRRLRVLARVAGLAVAGVLVLGSFNSIDNLSTYGDPIGPVKEINKRDTPVYANLVRTSWSFVETPGADMPWLNLALSRPLTAIAGNQTNSQFPGFVADKTVQEDVSAFGYVGWLILLPLLVFCLVAPRVSRGARVVAGSALLYLLVLAVLKKHDPFIARLLMPMVALAAPLLAMLYRHALLASVVAALAIVGTVPAVFINPEKPLLVASGAPTIFDLSSEQQQTLARPDFQPVLPALRRLVPDDAPIAVLASSNSYWYPFFGKGLKREVVPLTPDQGTRRQLRARGLAGMVYANAGRPRGYAVPLGADYWFVPAAD